MSLILGLKEREGFRVGPHRFKVAKILSETQFRLRDANGIDFDIDDQISKEIADQVWVMCGTRGQRALARIVIDAPRHLKISREQPGRPPRRSRQFALKPRRT